MRVELGNLRPRELWTHPITGEGRWQSLDGPAVSYLWIQEADETDAGYAIYKHPADHSDSNWHPELASALAGANDEARRLILDGWLSHPSGVRGLPDYEAYVAVVHPQEGFWANVSEPGTRPAWVWSDDPALQAFLAKHYGCPEGRPENLEDVYWTQYGKLPYPPGCGPTADAVALHTNTGRDIQAVEQFGFGYLGTTGTATATGGTSLTGGTETGASHASNDCAFQVVYASSAVPTYGLITSNTSGTTPVYTVDRWYLPASPGGAAATTPSATTTYQVVSGGAPCIFVGLSTSVAAPAATDTTLASEITTAGGGLIRKIAPVGHTAGGATVTLTPVFTANGSDTLPVTIGKAGASASLLSTTNNQYQTLVSPTATLSASGDQLTLTWTFTMT